jgi:hypothetical protein
MPQKRIDIHLTQDERDVLVALRKAIYPVARYRKGG